MSNETKIQELEERIENLETKLEELENLIVLVSQGHKIG